MDRRTFLAVPAAVLAGCGRPSEAPLVVAMHRLIDQRTPPAKAHLDRFWQNIWPRAVADFGRCGIQFSCTDAPGLIRLSPGGRPMLLGLQRRVINLMLTDHLPQDWDKARALAGISGLHEGCCLCMVATRFAHNHQVPFLSVNTCVHELLHVFMQDVFVKEPTWAQTGKGESRIDWLATRLWLFGDGAEIRRSAAESMARLNSAAS